ncbi:quinol:cytochrome c oxidoreductase monoheme cytochrome subunit [Chitinophaga jiangningensis]|uniref:Quinol:cytochrome c oxidoreductase monoheme cytochrome subunit n=1 Tax=Chitinophaga jiangningensis TaxID=1419482 RepID=A0A1M7E3I1_9BACT|nr:cytochrome c [Chitinophaga jiangningensis]SHL86315.1 quinol:cytochrome c oxidoreductase monoheme cytochrome subunit [Chitinophaga jiangningensis]
MKRTSNILIVAALATGAFLAACNRGEHNRKPGRIYMPDMYESRAYEFYNARLSGMKPVEGTVKRGEVLPYHLKESDTALANLVKNPLTITAADLAEGERLFNIYCGICHGTALDGNGPLYKGGEGPYPAAPANLASGPKAAYSEGRLFHVMTYGFNAMGSYASQLDRAQRWKIAAYIKSKNAPSAAPAAAAAPATDSAATAK